MDKSLLSTAARVVVLLCIAGAITSLFSTTNLPIILLIAALFGAFSPVRRAWVSARGTALRPAIIWSVVAISLSILAQFAALQEPVESGRPLSGQITYLSTVAVFATLTSVLNARTPGGGAWAILMVMLMVVFLVPWLEGSGLVREGNGWDRLRLNPPWTIFYGLLVIAGVTNYVPTRFGQSAFVLALGFVLQYLVLTQLQWTHQVRGQLGTCVGICWAASIWLADVAFIEKKIPAPGLPRLWWWFRNSWGVVWALRVQERFNRTAEAASWPIRLNWHGVISANPSANLQPLAIPPEAEATLAGLLRRFATAGRLSEAGGSQENIDLSAGS